MHYVHPSYCMIATNIVAMLGGGYCNFMHMKHVPRSLKRKMIRRMFEDHPDYKRTAGMYVFTIYIFMFVCSS